jgi:hypothetical protein
VELPAGLIRALRFGANWPDGDIEDALQSTFEVGAGEDVIVTAGGEGKIVFSAAGSDLEVVYDVPGDYYRIIRMGENGTITAQNSEGEYLPNTEDFWPETHFDNTGRMFTSIEDAESWVDTFYGEPGPNPSGYSGEGEGDAPDPGFGGGGAIGPHFTEGTNQPASGGAGINDATIPECGSFTR